jgi:hypothetical protein
VVDYTSVSYRDFLRLSRGNSDEETEGIQLSALRLSPLDGEPWTVVDYTSVSYRDFLPIGRGIHPDEETADIQHSALRQSPFDPSVPVFSL